MNRFVSPVVRGFIRQRNRWFDRRLGLPRPEGVARTHAPGTSPDRVLLFGSGPAVGWGVRSHDLGLAGHLARAVSLATGRGVDVDVVADPAMRTADARRVLGDRDLTRYDTVVLVTGINDALEMTDVTRWRRAFVDLLVHIETETGGASSPVLVTGVQSPSEVTVFRIAGGGLVDRHAAELNAVIRDVCSTHPRVHVLMPPSPLSGHDDRDRLIAKYARWGEAQAEMLAPMLDAQMSAGGGVARARRHAPQAEVDRVEAIRSLGLLDTDPEERFDDIVERARTLLGASGAAFSLVTADRTWNKALVGGGDREMPAALSFCAHTVAGGQPFIVEDAWADERFGVAAPARFYAGYPVESPEGVRIGALCVADPEPRTVESVDLVMLRELALSVQRELAKQVVAR
ncbi:GAF domain-containing protein [Frigoribacterium sp. VKM Ac-2836]|uniref:GAF domain-containing protein n=1 Tax=Frigoribacterium sp. VKM Ac-2836 TaxID=2739014 RepID=UPI00156578CC|nr:GAF domain-containing protein [Frigoribacterium sp. VKM Ac-2836]NRD25066.1 GAF domain-containing protein [Frigoribacterium sp. VKM Ac-2836]